MTHNIYLSIVLVTYGNQSHIRQCISTLSHALVNYASQLVIIDNNSPDATASVIKGFLQEPLSFRDVQFITNKFNTGFTRGVNQGLARCTGEYILVLNPDLFVTDGLFTTLFEILENGQAEVVSPQFRFPDGRIQPSCRHFPRKRDVLYELCGLSRLLPKSRFNRWKMPDFDHQSTRLVDQPQGAFLLTSRRVMESVGHLDERFPMFFSDVDWCKRVVIAGYRILFTAGVFVHHVKGASIRKKRANMIVSSHRSFVDYFAKYDQTPTQRLFTRVLYLLLLIVLAPRILMEQIR